MSDAITSVWAFLGDNWALVALVVSEVAAFLPNKWNGIAQSVLKVGSAIFGKKNVKS